MRYPRTEWAAGISRVALQRALADLGIDAGATSTQIASLEARIAALEANAGASAGAQPTTIEFNWSFGLLNPLQSVVEDFDVSGVAPGTPVIVNTALPSVWLNFYADCQSADKVHVIATNVGANPVSVSTLPLRITYFN